MNQFNLLNERGIEVTELINIGEDLRTQWEITFTMSLTKAIKNKIHFKQHSWHVFSYEELECLEKQKAITAFNNQKKNEFYIFYQTEKNALMIENAKDISSEDVMNIRNGYVDVYVVDKGFTWTYIVTHEESCGPYFYKLNGKYSSLFS